MGLSAMSMVNRGTSKKVSTLFDEPSDTCIGCASCASVCPTDAIKVEDRDGIRRIWGREFKMIKCSRCGSYFTTEEHFKYVKNRSDSVVEILCECCKRGAIAEEMADVYSGI